VQAQAPAPVAAPGPSEPPPTPEPAEPTAPVASEPPHSVRVGLAYLAQDFSEQTPIDHGALLTVRIPARTGLYAGVGIVGSPASGPVGEEGLRVQRVPIVVLGGYRLAPLVREQELFLDLEQGLVLELLKRDLETSDGATPDTSRVLFGFASRVRLEWKPWNLLGLSLGAGLDLMVTTLRYEADLGDGTERKLLLRAHWFRPTLEAGFALYL